jgi:carbamoyltransferase|tara:strand:- start:4122 stop:5651 length:1530 start_codon:yes stop_codon:yes gene_type:complete
MKILGLQFSHDASACIIDNGRITFYQEESMLSGKKKDHNINYLWQELQNQSFDIIIFGHPKLNHELAAYYKTLIEHHCSVYNIKFNTLTYSLDHHLQHAACAVFNSGFKDAYCLIMDGSGTPFYYNKINIGNEIESIFYFNKNNFNLKWKVCNGPEVSYTDSIHAIQSLSPALLFKYAASYLGSKEPGAVMGLSSYSNQGIDMPVYYKSNDLYKVNQNLLWHMMVKTNHDKYKITHSIQKESNQLVLDRVEKILKMNPNANICLSGGYFQNCQTNGYILGNYENVFVDPLAHDGGTSMGLALLAAHEQGIKVKPYENLYLGLKPKYPKLKANTSVDQIVKLLEENNVVAIYQGKQEAGPRALGNRSLLFNPTNPNAKDIVNKLKKREWYRPYAGTIMKEHFKKYFNLPKKETPYMSYAAWVKRPAALLGITHIDYTCRVQTLTEKQNPNFYKLLKAWYKKTGCPVLLNTSLNIAGKPLVNSYDQVMEMLNTTELNYVYMPEINYLAKKK